MYSFSDLLDGIRHPYKIGRELNLLYHRRLRLHDYNHDGIDIFAEDWDNLVLLDACRYDEFEQLCEYPGRLGHRESRGSSSNEFVRGNLRGRELLDTVCVTANAWYMEIDDFELNQCIPLVGEQFLDDELGTVLPSTVTEHAKEAAEQYPKKRLIVHYMQPHTPYIGPTGREHFEGFKTRSDLAEGRFSPGSFDQGVLRRAYRENLEIVLEEVRELLDMLEGKTVISADHGEMLGERHFPVPMRDYMHPHGVDNEVLVKVPWFVCEHEERRSIVAEDPSEPTERVEESSVKSHLEKLGYLK